ncbi:MAG: dUTP diphosphatase [Proteobacteria bacterium]|nr:dUTP diphosphatase [Pseudomonadota bacterium]
MFHFRFHEDCTPRYMTQHSAAADLVARVSMTAEVGKVICVPTGVWIAEVDWALVPEGFIPELQIRARSGLARKNSLMLANGVGTVDADYRDEIGVLLLNLGQEAFEIKAGDRIAQIALNLVGRMPALPVGTQRLGGFGSTNV